MSEYWKSTPKYWCKHCKTFVVDTKLSRTQHDATGKHQGALARFLRDLHRNYEKEANAKEAAKKEVARLDAITSGKPTPSGSGSSSATPSQPRAPVRPPTEAELKNQLKQLESLGVALPEEYRKEVALPGEWVNVDSSPLEAERPKATLASRGKQQELENKEKVKEEILRKRKAEEAEAKWQAMDEDEKVIRGFKIQEKTYPGQDEDLEDLLSSGSIRKRTKLTPPVSEGIKAEVEVKEENGEASNKAPIIAEDGVSIKPEPGTTEETTVDAAEEKAPAFDGFVFKKRKAKNIRKK